MAVRTGKPIDFDGSAGVTEEDMFNMAYRIAQKTIGFDLSSVIPS